MKHFKKFLWLYTIVGFLAYWLVGSLAPFVTQKEITQQSKNRIKKQMEHTTKANQDYALILEENTNALKERIRLMSKAKKEIILTTFDFREGKSSDDLISVMLKKAKEGVKVKVLVDGISGLLRMQGKTTFYALAEAKNVEVKVYNPLHLFMPFKSQGRMHDKYVIVDDTAFLLGGRNTFDYFLGDYRKKGKSLDREILIYNNLHGTDQTKQSAVWQMKEYSTAVWEHKESKVFHKRKSFFRKSQIKKETERLEQHYSTLVATHPDYFEEEDYSKVGYRAKNIQLLHNPIDIYAKEPLLYEQIMEYMKTAKKRVVIQTPYYVGNAYMDQGLKEVADHVEDARMLINSIENGDNFMASSDYMIHKKDLVDTGLALYEFDGGTSTHGKSIVIDDSISLIGSFNLDLRSVYMNTELMLVVESEELNKQLSGYMEHMQSQSRKVIDEKNYEKAPNVKVAVLPFFTRVIMRIVGVFMQPFRFTL